MDMVRAAAGGRHRDGLEAAAMLHDPVGLDQCVDDEGASRLPLAVMTMTAMDEHRRGGEPVAHRPARAAAFQDTGQFIPPSRVSRLL